MVYPWGGKRYISVWEGEQDGHAMIVTGRISG